MPSSLDQAAALLNFSRGYYGKSLKSSHKTFLNTGTAEEARIRRRNSNAQLADRVIKNRNSAQAFVQLVSAAAGRRVGLRGSGLKAGNAEDYVDAAIEYGVHLSIPNMWVASNGDHCFLLLVGEYEEFGEDWFELSVPEFQKFYGKGLYCCDPWLNTACALEMYHLNVLNKAQKWSVEGKCIEIEGRRQLANHWLQDWIMQPFLFMKATDDNGASTRLQWRY